MTINEAKAFYKEYNGSYFAMAREDLLNYNLYRDLNIEKEIELKWKEEMMEELAVLLRDTGEYIHFARLYDLAESFHNREKLMLLIGVIDNVKLERAEISLCIVETIIGRKTLSVRSGMIFWAYDIGEKEEAFGLIEKAKALVMVQTDSEEVEERAYRDMETINQIVKILELA